jgi:hypothetical protein
MKIIKKIIIFTLIITISLTISVQKTIAINDYYVSNNVLFFNGDDSISFNDLCINPADIVYSQQAIENQKIAANFFSTTNFLGNNNKPLNAVQMAAIMGNIHAESNFNPEAINNSNGYYGLVQWGEDRKDNIPNPKNKITTQLTYIKTELDDNYYKKEVGNFWNISDPSDIDEATFLIARNYEVAIISENIGETYWTNDNDATIQLQHWLKRKLAARNFLTTFGASSGLECKGMTHDQAVKYMETYENSDGNDLRGAAICDGYPLKSDHRNKLANCVAVVKYFIQNHLSIEGDIPLPDGGKVVETLIKYGFTDGGNTPKPYAIFSTNRYGDEWGHTGLILGIENDQFIVFQENCGEKLHKDNPGGFAGIKKYSISELSSKYTFAYPPEGKLINL